MFAHMKIHKTAAGLHYGTTIDNWLHFAHTHTHTHMQPHTLQSFPAYAHYFNTQNSINIPFFPYNTS